MKRFILPLVIALAAAPAFAQNVTIFTPRKGGGVIETPGNVTPQQAAILMGQNAPPKGTTGVIIVPKEPVSWTDLPPSEIDKKFGGDGNPERRLFPNGKVNQKPAEELFPKSADNEPTKPIVIFPEEEHAETSDNAIKPNAGNWVGNLQDQTITGCPKGIIEPLAAQFAGLDGSPVQGTIDASFNPATLMPQLAWKKTGRNSWVGDLDRIQPGGFGMRVQWGVQIKSPDLIKNHQQINANLPGGTSCKVVTFIDYNRIN